MARPSPKRAHHRARVARLAQSYPADDPKVVAARRDLRAVRIEEFIEQALAEVPPLTDQQRTHLAELLRPPRQPAPERKADGAVAL